MKIALLTDGIFPYVIGGMQRHSFYLAKYLTRAGVEVDLYHTGANEKEISRLEGFTEDEKRNLRSFAVPFPSFGRSPGHYIRESYEYSRRIYNEFQKQAQPDFIYVKGFAGWELLNQKSKGEKFAPVGLNFHGYEMFQPQPGLVSWLQSRILLRHPVLFNVRNADFLFSYGGKITPLIQSLGVRADRIIELPAGISEDWLNTGELVADEKRKFVFVGRYERRKGIRELNHVIRSLGNDFNGEFHFIGNIPDGKKIISDNIIYHGEIRDSAIMQQSLRKMDVLICPSYSEGMPNVVLEALASGLAVIATDTGATSVMVNSGNGWLIAPGDKKQLLSAISAAGSVAPGQLLTMKRNAVACVASGFCWEKTAEKTIEHIREICKTQR